ncbi:MAG: YigZ family protein [Desulfococcaceae bacterium]|jgi:uncharacterized YigZ family protein|nr:YigZ family protein [Desulfococcaceae bacterium]
MNYFIPKEICRTEESIRRSRFIATAAHADSPETAKHFILEIKKEFPDATHNCWAFAAGAPGDTARVGMSDDGEPRGTAGRPMLNVLLNSDMGETAVVVTRYFGGTKLGTGGLVRAYSSAVQKVLEAIPRTEKILRRTVDLITEYSYHEAIRRAAERFEGLIRNEIFGADVSMRIEIPEKKMEHFTAFLTDICKGDIILEKE